MKGQVTVMEEMLVFALSFIILINLVVIFSRIGSASTRMIERQALMHAAETSAVALTKAIVGKGSVLFSLPKQVGGRAYEIRDVGGELVAYDGSEASKVSMFGLLKPYSSRFREFSGLPFKVATFNGSIARISRVFA